MLVIYSNEVLIYWYISVHLLYSHVCNYYLIITRTNVGTKRFYENLFGAKTSVKLFLSFENCRKQYEGSHESAHNWHANHLGIQFQKVQSGKPVNGHPRDCVPMILQIGTRRTKHNPEFCYRYNYMVNRPNIRPQESSLARWG